MDERERKMREQMIADGYRPVGPSIAISADDVAHGAGPVMGVPDGLGYIDVDQQAIRGICERTWDAMVEVPDGVSFEDHVKDICLRVALNAYAFGYLQGRHDKLSEQKADDAG